MCPRQRKERLLFHKWWELMRQIFLHFPFLTLPPSTYVLLHNLLFLQVCFSRTPCHGLLIPTTGIIHMYATFVNRGRLIVVVVKMRLSQNGKWTIRIRVTWEASFLSRLCVDVPEQMSWSPPLHLRPVCVCYWWLSWIFRSSFLPRRTKVKRRSCKMD